MKLHELREARSKAVVAMRTLADLAEKESRDLNADEEKRFSELKTEVADLDKKIDRAVTLAEYERAAPAIVHGNGDGRFEERARDFSITKAIRASLPRDLGGGDVDVGFEREMSAEVSRRTGKKFEGIAVPDQVFDVEARTLLTSGAAADLIPNVHRADLFINRLRASLVTGRLGATVIDGLIGTIDIPRQTDSSQAQHVDEDGSLTETDADFDDITLTPKTVGAMTSYSRRTLLNASPAIENLVRNDLASVVASAIDYQAIFGDTSGNTPRGVLHQSGIAEVSLAGGATWEKILEFIATIQHANASGGSMGWAMNAHAVKKLRSTTKVNADAGAGFIMESPSMLAGYRVATSSVIPGDHNGSPAVPATMIFGDWTSLIVGYWSGLDLLVNPYETTAYAKGRVLVRAMRDYDVQIRHAESFAYADDLPV
jgi:HK97 family phage major capsid protein